MSNSDHWGSLASNLGAEVPAEPETPAAKPPAPPAPPPRPVAAAPKKPAPPKPNADWSQLATNLGIEPSEPAPPAAPVSRPTPAAQVRPEPRPQQRVERKSRAPEESAPVESGGFFAEEEAEVVQAEVSDVVEGDVIDGDAIEGEVIEPSEEPREEGEGDEPGGRKRRRRRRGGRRSRRGREDRGETPADERDEAGREFDEEKPLVPPELDVDPLAGIDTFESLDDEGEETSLEAGSDEAGDDEPRERKGRRRRRRRGSGRGREERAPREPAAEGDEEPLADELAEDDDELAEVAAFGDEPGDEGAENNDKNSHRAIPSWDEAIGYIIAVNMETRAKNPKATHPRGRGRGRGRGGNGRTNGQRRT